jgi:hypothetical protein
VRGGAGERVREWRFRGGANDRHMPVTLPLRIGANVTRAPGFSVIGLTLPLTVVPVGSLSFAMGFTPRYSFALESCASDDYSGSIHRITYYKLLGRTTTPRDGNPGAITPTIVWSRLLGTEPGITRRGNGCDKK